MIFIKARSCLERTTDDGKEKDAKDFSRLVREQREPLLLDGFPENTAKDMRSQVLDCLEEIARWRRYFPCRVEGRT